MIYFIEFLLRLFPNYGYAEPPPLRNGHLDIRDAQCALKNDWRKISSHTISRLGATGVQKGCFGRPKIQLSSKTRHLQGELELT